VNFVKNRKKIKIGRQKFIFRIGETLTGAPGFVLHNRAGAFLKTTKA
jgi:hypothetical protein